MENAELARLVKEFLEAVENLRLDIHKLRLELALAGNN